MLINLYILTEDQLKNLKKKKDMKKTLKQIEKKQHIGNSGDTIDEDVAYLRKYVFGDD